MSKSTNTKDLKSKIVHFRVMCDSDLADRDAGVITQDEYAKSIEHRLDILVEYIAKDRQQILDSLIDEEIRLYKMYEDNRDISVGIKIMADRVREKY